jgi:hypothetical protein
MNLGEALRDRIVVPDTWEGHRVWICSSCGAYLVPSHGKYCFSCSCHDDKLNIPKPEVQENTNPILS